MSQVKLKAYHAYLKTLYAASKIVTLYLILCNVIIYCETFFLMKKNGYR